MRKLVIAFVLLQGLGACSPETSGDGGGGLSGGSGGKSGSSGTSSGGMSGGFSFGGSGATGPGGTGSLGDAACTGADVAGERTPANILFIVDRSGSMNCNPPPIQASANCETTPRPTDPAQPIKWNIVKDALKTAIAGLPVTSSGGIVYFPNDNLCGVSAQPDVPVDYLNPTHVAALHASLDGVMPSGNTPIVGGVTLGYEYLRQAMLSGDKFVVLLTDGQETCAASQVNDFRDKTVPQAFSIGIRTFVIGAPGSENASGLLSQVAFNGGTPQAAGCDHSGMNSAPMKCHFDMTASGNNFAQQLNQALDAISSSTVSCEIDIPPPPDGGKLDLSKVNVTLLPGGTSPPQPLAQDKTRKCSAGSDWEFNADQTKIVLCPNTCSTYKSNRNASVKIELGCEPRIKIT